MTAIRCVSCDKQKDKLHRVQSTVVESLELKLCAACSFDDYEPRWVIVLAARSGVNVDRVKELVTNRKYYGDDIELREVLA